MMHLLSEEGREVLRAMVTRPLLYAFDFDGTLAPIASDRHAVKISPIVLEWLQELAVRAPCAVVSGRSLADLAPRINGSVPHVIGNHGIEGPLSSAAVLSEAEQICAGWKRALQTGLASVAESLGAEIEDKRYSLTVHLRRAADPVKAGVKVLGLLRRLNPEPQLLTGKYSINALPPGRSGKGAAAYALMTHLRREGLFYIGDEETDETVFTLPPEIVIGVRVGRHAESRARFYLHHQGEVEEVLRFLVHRMDRTPESGRSAPVTRAGQPRSTGGSEPVRG
ncbi:MAG TPA: trehalose-phosphatase [Nitrospira sp.]|nr:trehalose-phosphatase [Nitrospira sp.]